MKPWAAWRPVSSAETVLDKEKKRNRRTSVEEEDDIIFEGCLATGDDLHDVDHNGT